jgi:hypothetical protein
MSGGVEGTGAGGHPQALLLRLDQPVPGIASMFALSMGGQTHLIMDFYFYGERASAAAMRDEPLWQAWMQQRFARSAAAGDIC